MANNNLLSEVERQRKYLEELPEGYNFPLFNARRALESQRQSGYRHTAAAAREIVDNAIEAHAKNVYVALKSVKGPRKRVVSEVAFIDDGAGMLPEMARYALSWGGGSHFEDAEFIAKFGFGLPNSSINQARRTEVYTRISPDQPIFRALLDIDEFAQFGVQSIPEAEEAHLPAWLTEYMDRNNIKFNHGTIVVWSRVDRLSYRTPGNLKEHLLDDFGVVYRYMVQDGGDEDDSNLVKIVVEGVQVEPVDPLFLDPHARYYVSPEAGGSERTFARSLAVAYNPDAEVGEPHLTWLRNPDDVSSAKGVVTTMYVQVARLPVGFATRRDVGALDEFSRRRWEIRKSRRGMSFVRSTREIQTVDVFPRSAQDKASGLGDWPLLQSYAYHWGVEVRFGPELDSVFGITNDKQSVRPIEDFWRVLHDAEVDRALREEQGFQRKAREEQRAKLPEVTDDATPTVAEQSAELADAAVGTVIKIPEHLRSDARQRLEDEVEERARQSGTTREAALKAAEEEASRKKYKIVYADDPHGPFYDPEWVGGQIVVRINTAHPFFKVLYSDLFRLPGGSRAKGATDLLLIAMSRAEVLAQDEQMTKWYRTQRKHVWSPFLEMAMENLAEHLPWSEDELAGGTEGEVA